jgi:hypothetical protein
VVIFQAADERILFPRLAGTGMRGFAGVDGCAQPTDRRRASLQQCLDQRGADTSVLHSPAMAKAISAVAGSAGLA